MGACPTSKIFETSRLLKRAGGIPAHGNQRSVWDAGRKPDFPNPELRRPDVTGLGGRTGHPRFGL